MGRWQASARSVRLCVAALLLSLPALVCGAHQIETPAEESIVESVLGSAEEIVESPAPSPTSTPLWGGDLRTRSQLTGDWGGARDALATKGLTFFRRYHAVLPGRRERRPQTTVPIWRPR